VLGRGYAVCWDETHTTIVRDAARVHPGDEVQVELARGAIRCAVKDSRPTDGRDTRGYGETHGKKGDRHE
jgi:exonuclease VII large subunit